MGEANFYVLFRGENNTAGAVVLDGFAVVLLQPKSWQTADSRVPSHGKRPRDVEGRAGRVGRVGYMSGIFPSCHNFMKFKEIRRTSTFAWSPAASLPLLATGTVAGALDESFSNESQLEIWAPDFFDDDEFQLGADPAKGPKGLVTDTSRYEILTIVIDISSWT